MVPLLELLLAIRIERIPDTSLEARNAGSQVLNLVIVTYLSHAERAGGTSLIEVVAEGRGDTSQPAVGDVALAAQRDRAPSIGFQTKHRFSAIQTTALGLGTVHQAVTVFQREDGLQAITQIFAAPQAPAIARLSAIPTTRFGCAGDRKSTRLNSSH